MSDSTPADHDAAAIITGIRKKLDSSNRPRSNSFPEDVYSHSSEKQEQNEFKAELRADIEDAETADEIEKFQNTPIPVGEAPQTFNSVDKKSGRKYERRANRRESKGLFDAARRGFRAVLALLKPQKGDPIAPPKLDWSIILGSALINILALALPLVLLQVYDRVLPNQAGETLFVLVAAMLVVTLVDVLLKGARSYIVGWKSAKHQMGISADAVNRVLHTPASVISRERPSVHINRLDSINSLREFYGGNLHMLLIDLPFVPLYLALIAFIGGWVAIIPLALFVFSAIRILFLGAQLRKIWDDKTEQANRKYDFIMECLNNIFTIKSLAMEPFMQRRYERLKRYSAEAGYQAIYLANVAQTTAYLYANFSLVALVSVGAWLAIQGHLTVGSLAACVLLNGRAIQPLTKGLALYAQVQQLYSARSRAEELFRMTQPVVVEQVPADSIRGDLTLSNLSFSYEESKSLLKDVDLEIKRGEFIGLQAADGAGKSTLMKLIMGELEPQGGSIKLDGHDLHGPLGESLRSRIAYVPPYANILRGSILENITMFKSGEAVEVARHAARLLGLEDDIFKLHKGYDTILGRSAVEELPAGLLQRIMVARALARRPSVLLFDEGNASLDSRSDKLLREGFEKLHGHMTMLIISQRPSFLRISDKILELGDGVIRPMPARQQDASSPNPMADQKDQQSVQNEAVAS